LALSLAYRGAHSSPVRLTVDPTCFGLALIIYGGTGARFGSWGTNPTSRKPPLCSIRWGFYNFGGYGTGYSYQGPAEFANTDKFVSLRPDPRFTDVWLDFWPNVSLGEVHEMRET
jgi:hypothetical protein